MEKGFKEVKIIRQLLINKEYNELAELLKGCWGKVSESSRYGRYNFSTISSYLIHAPLELFLKLDKLDYDDKQAILKVILQIYPHQDNAPEIIDIKFIIDENLEVDDSFFVSTEKGTKEQNKTITFTPSVFKIPDKNLNDNLVSVMMPYSSFDNVYEQIKNACKNSGFECKRADDIWDNSTFIQDIFDLIFTSKIVIVDFSNKNPNVFYEAGIAHTLGKIVIPIVQNLNDVPSDLGQHRVLEYLNNTEGLNKLRDDLSKKLNSYKPDYIKSPF